MAKKAINIEVGERIQGLIQDRFKDNVESVIRHILNVENGEEILKKIRETGIDYMESVEYAMKEVCPEIAEEDESYQLWIIETIVKGYNVEPTRDHAILMEIAHNLIRELKDNDIEIDCWSIKKNGDKASGKATMDCDIAIDVNKRPEKLHKEFWTDSVPYNDKLIRLKFVIKQ